MRHMQNGPPYDANKSNAAAFKPVDKPQQCCRPRSSASKITATCRKEQQHTRQQRQHGHQRLVGDLHQRDGRPRRRVAVRRGHRDGNIRASSSAELERAGNGGCGRRLRPAHDLHISHATHSTARLPATQVAAISAMPGSESARGSAMLPMLPPLPLPPACKRAGRRQGSGRVLPATAGLRQPARHMRGRCLLGQRAAQFVTTCLTRAVCEG